MLEEAIAYSKLEWSVVPLVRNFKFPPKGITWKDRQTTRATESEIRKWWEENPDCNIGIVTGAISNMDVLDFDSREDLERFEATVCEIPETIKQTTGRKDGLHACFEHHGGGMGIVTDAKYGGMVDVRTDGGIFVVAPSVHKSGKQYQWVNINPLEMGLDDLLPMPKEIVEFLVECKAKQKEKADKLDPDAILMGDGIPDGLRNKDLYRYACRLRSKGMTTGEAFVLVELAAANCDPPCQDPKKEAQEKVAAAWQHEKSYFIGKAFIPSELAEHINRNHDILHDGSGFFQYDPGGVWRAIHDNVIAKRIKAELGQRASQARIHDTMKMLEIETFKQADDTPRLINLLNGMLDLEKGLLPHDKNYFSKVQVPIVFDPKADCPRFKQFLREVFVDDIGRANAVQDFSGYCLYPEIFIHICLWLIGHGSNGKSVLANILTKLIGLQNVSGIALHQLADKFILGSLKDKLLNVSTEASSKGQVADDVFKKVVSGDYVQADRKFRDPFLFRPIAKHLFLMNSLPVITDRTFALARRIEVVKFEQTFTGDRADKHLEAKLEMELSGILNWSLVGLARVLETNEITESPKMLDDKKEMLRAINPALTFVDERCVVSPDARIGKEALYTSYRQFCEESGLKATSNIKFYRQLTADFPELAEVRPDAGTRMFQGIGVVP